MFSDTKIYSSKEVAKRLSIEPVTVRKYSQMLEAQGYSFQKDSKDWRQYTEDDIRFLEYICNMKSMGKSLDESVNHVASLYRASLSISNTAISLQDPREELFEFMKQQQEFNKQLLERLEAQEQRQRERDQQLIIALNQSLETQKQIAAAKQKKWWKFWE